MDKGVMPVSAVRTTNVAIEAARSGNGADLNMCVRERAFGQSLWAQCMHARNIVGNPQVETDARLRAPPRPFDLIAHADWSIRPVGRWRATAQRKAEGGWHIRASQPVGDVARLVPDLRAEARGGAALLGADLPIGAPVAWAAKAGVTSFRTVLPEFGQGPWENFYNVAAAPKDISPTRPFYPMRPGGTNVGQLVDGLGLANALALRRACDFDAAGKAKGSPLFWTMGGSQVGKAAGAFWRDVLAPALAAGQSNLWPFDGALADLARAGCVTVAETYPGEIYNWFDLALACPTKGMGKQSIEAREAEAPRLLKVGESLGAKFDPAAKSQIVSGFPDGKDDAFDAMVGLLGVMSVVEGARPEYAPAPKSSIADIEGWILGREPPPDKTPE